MPRTSSSRSPSKSATPSKSRGAAPDALRILAEDHKKVKKMFDEFEKNKSKPNFDEAHKQLLVETACAELTIHAQLEEELFYPAAREAIDDLDLLDEAEVEHAVAKQLISELAAMQPDDDLYDAKFTVLGEYVKHHIDEEEKELFPKVKKSDLDLTELAEEINERKLALREELGFNAEDEDETEIEEPSSQTRKKNIH